MLFRPSFVALIFALVAIGTPAKRGTDQVLEDLEDMNHKTLVLKQVIVTLPSDGATLSEALNVHTHAVVLEGSTDTTTSDVSASEPFDKMDGAAVIQFMKTPLVPNVLQCLQDLIDKKGALTAIHANYIALEDLRSLNLSANALGDAMMAKTTADQRYEAEQLLDEINIGFTNAIDYFSH